MEVNFDFLVAKFISKCPFSPLSGMLISEMCHNNNIFDMRRGLGQPDGGDRKEGEMKWRMAIQEEGHGGRRGHGWDTEEGSVGEAERRGTKNIFPLAES